MICLSCYHFATQLGSTHENRAVRDWTNPTRLPMYFSPRYGAKTRSGSPCQSPAMPNGRCRMHGDLRPALRRGIRSSGLDTADDAALHVRCWPLDDLVINSDVRFAPKAEVPKK